MTGIAIIQGNPPVKGAVGAGVEVVMGMEDAIPSDETFVTCWVVALSGPRVIPSDGGGVGVGVALAGVVVGVME